MAVAVVDLGLTPEGAGKFTPVELYFLYGRFLARRKQHDWEMAVLTSSIINAGFCRPKEPVRPEDLMPQASDRKGRRVKRKRRMSARRQEQIAEKVARFFGG